MIPDRNFDHLVQPTRLHRDLYIDPELFELEMSRIWGQAWIFIGHESQIPEPGDYFTTNIDHKTPVVMIRDTDGSIKVLHNRCGHKGARLVVERQGKVRGAFNCSYHGWRFRFDGSLLAVPNEKGYADTGFDSSDPCYGMRPLAQVDHYRGFVFATLSEKAPALLDWMGGARDCFDNLCDRAPEGEVEVAGGVTRYEHQCNWKFILENLNDTMHPMVVHQSVVQAAKQFISTLPEDAVQQRSEAEIIPPFGASYETFENSGITGFNYGHHYDGGKTSIHADYSVMPEYHEAMVAAYGEERTREIYAFNTHNVCFYPSLTIKCAVQNIRVIRPIAVDRFIVETWSFRLKGAPDAMLQRTLLYSRLINSAMGMVGPDDLEVYRRAQEGHQSPAGEWIEFHRGYGTDQQLDDRIVGGGTSDLDMRTQYRAWKDYMQGAIFDGVDQ
ncbi:biphenyl dioxygenase subunit alpha [Luminiphilus syltensis NOR5-1B]|uniref:Biphenyl dioxygenase subunit alpha n=2 Tax=Luminiphilus TaxID=1341118 RepID=B8KTB9_9GAMM|nr:biphenyl dioxygenase subunit alpha [Luminiphilus syltensis NOR5-1B]